MPYVLSTGKVQKLIEARGAGDFWVSVTHDGDTAVAFVVLSGGFP
jgi:holo-[acyl-carrier protein] synthase